MTHQGRRADRIKWTTNSMAASRDLIRDFLGSVPAKCENCGCCAPKITPEGANKIYRASLTGKQREANAALDIDLDGELADLAAPGEDAQEDGRELAGQDGCVAGDIEAARNTDAPRVALMELIAKAEQRVVGSTLRERSPQLSARHLQRRDRLYRVPLRQGIRWR